MILIALFLVLNSSAPSLAITNGQPDGDAHPYVGLIVFDVYVPDVGNVPAWRCSGSLIAPDVILTAGHCTDGAVAARVWFNERLQDDNGNFLVPDYPWGGVVAIEGTPYTNPDFCLSCSHGQGLPAFSYRDVGIVVLDEPVFMSVYAELPEAGLVDTLRNKTNLDIVGYGVQEQLRGGGPPYWMGLKVRLYAPSKLVSGKFVHSDEFMKISLNHSRGKGGACFGDSGGPDLLANTDTILAVHSYVTNYNCAGVGYSSRVDIPEVLEWIVGFLD
jgi:hypothetical protein